MTGENIIFFEEIIVILLLIASVVAVLARRLRIPYTVGLVLIGLSLSLLSPTRINISPQVILALLVPPLIFEAAFIANSFIFLLIGLTIDMSVMLENWQAILWAILAALVARAVSIYGFSVFGRELPSKWRHILFWGGLRGASRCVHRETRSGDSCAME